MSKLRNIEWSEAVALCEGADAYTIHDAGASWVLCRRGVSKALCIWDSRSAADAHKALKRLANEPRVAASEAIKALDLIWEKWERGVDVPEPIAKALRASRKARHRLARVHGFTR